MGGLQDADFDTWRSVIDVNSAVAAPSQVLHAAYAASKGALTSAMYSLARELGPYRIRVNTVLPGWMWGPTVQAYVRFTAHAELVLEEVLGRLTARMALPEPPTDGDVADAVVFLASDRARAITGQSPPTVTAEPPN